MDDYYQVLYMKSLALHIIRNSGNNQQNGSQIIKNESYQIIQNPIPKQEPFDSNMYSPLFSNNANDYEEIEYFSSSSPLFYKNEEQPQESLFSIPCPEDNFIISELPLVNPIKEEKKIKKVSEKKKLKRKEKQKEKEKEDNEKYRRKDRRQKREPSVDLSPEKLEKRRLQTRHSSRLYRQRKKEQEKEMEVDYQNIQKEKELLEKETLKLREELSQLQRENELLQEKEKLLKIPKPRIELLNVLENLVQKEDAEKIISTVFELKNSPCCENCYKKYPKNSSIQRLICKKTLDHLSGSHIFEKIFSLVLNNSITLTEFIGEIRTMVPSLSAEQNAKFEIVSRQYNDRDSRISDERKELQNLLSPFIQKIKASKKVNFEKKESVEMFEIFQKLEQNYNSESNEWFLTTDYILEQILTPVQLGKLTLRLESLHLQMCEVQMAWRKFHSTFSSDTQKH